MGLIKCIDCGAMVSDRAKACPYCGGPIDESVIRMARMQQQQAARPQQVQQQQRPVQQPVHQPVHQSQPIQSQQPAQPRVKVSRIVQKSGEPQQAMSGAEGLTKKCVKCQRDIDINLKYCTYCGAKQLAASAALSAATSNDAPQQKPSAASEKKSVPPKRPITPPSNINNDDNQQPAEKSSHNNSFIYGGIAAVLLAGIITFFITRTRDGNEIVDEPSTELVEDSIMQEAQPIADEAKAASTPEEKPDDKASQAKQSKSDSHRHRHSSHKDKNKDKGEDYHKAAPATSKPVTPTARPNTPTAKPTAPANAKPAAPAQSPGRTRTKKIED